MHCHQFIIAFKQHCNWLTEDWMFVDLKWYLMACVYPITVLTTWHQSYLLFLHPAKVIVMSYKLYCSVKVGLVFFTVLYIIWCTCWIVGVIPASDEDASKGSLEKTDDQIQRRRGTGLWWGCKVHCYIWRFMFDFFCGLRITKLFRT